MTVAICLCCAVACLLPAEVCVRCCNKEEPHLHDRLISLHCCCLLPPQLDAFSKRMVNNSDSDDRTSSTSVSSAGYNMPSTLAPNQRDLRIQASVRNAAAAATAVNTDDEHKQEQPHDPDSKTRRPDLTPLDTKNSAYPGKESAQTASKNASDAIFAQLEVIQNLQVNNMSEPQVRSAMFIDTVEYHLFKRMKSPENMLSLKTYMTMMVILVQLHQQVARIH